MNHNSQQVKNWENTFDIFFPDQQTLPLENVISIQKEYLKTHPADNKQIDPCSFTIHYASKAEKSAKWVYKNLTLKHSDPMQVALWVKSLQKCLECKYLLFLLEVSLGHWYFFRLTRQGTEFFFMNMFLSVPK